MDLNWRTPDRQGRLLSGAAGIALTGAIMLFSDLTRPFGLGFLIGALILTVASLLAGRFLNRDD